MPDGFLKILTDLKQLSLSLAEELPKNYQA
jgi:hypothetical protein